MVEYNKTATGTASKLETRGGRRRRNVRNGEIKWLAWGEGWGREKRKEKRERKKKREREKKKKDRKGRKWVDRTSHWLLKINNTGESGQVPAFVLNRRVVAGSW